MVECVVRRGCLEKVSANLETIWRSYTEVACSTIWWYGLIENQSGPTACDWALATIAETRRTASCSPLTCWGHAYTPRALFMGQLGFGRVETG